MQLITDFYMKVLLIVAIRASCRRLQCDRTEFIL